MARRFQPRTSPFSESASPEELAKYILESGASGATISGGEPFEQADELKTLLFILSKGGLDDIIIYSGGNGDDLLREHPWVKSLAGCLIDGAFRRDLPTEAAWKGSENQRALIFRNPSLYETWLRSRKGELQVANRGENLFLIGVPRIGDAEKILGENSGPD